MALSCKYPFFSITKRRDFIISTNEPKSNILRVSDEYAGQRLDNYLLREFNQMPRSVMYRLVRTGQVRINGSRCKPMQKLAEADEIRLPPKLVHEKENQEKNAPQNPVLQPKTVARLNKQILFEDERLLVLNKPSGMAVHGGSGISMGVIEAFRSMRPDQPYLELVHRLDRATSGCLILAKKRSALRELHRQIRENEVKKQYLTLLKGHWDHRARVNLPLDIEHRKHSERHVVVSDQGKQAVSHFNVVEHLGSSKKQPDTRCSLMRVDLETGRTHQIRVHAEAMGHQIAGDDRYHDLEFNETMKRLGLKRMFLHAHYLEFVHPKTGEEVAISAPLPDELSRLIDKIKV